MSSTLWPNRSKAAPARCLPRPATTSWPRLLNLKYAMPAALSRVDSSRISGCPEENADPRPCTQMSAVRRRRRLGSAMTPSSQTPSRVRRRTSETETPAGLVMPGRRPDSRRRSTGSPFGSRLQRLARGAARATPKVGQSAGNSNPRWREPAGSRGAVLEVRALDGDLAALDREEAAAVDLDLFAIGRRAREDPLRHAAVARHEVVRVTEFGIREDLEHPGERRTHTLASPVARAADFRARGALEDAVVGHEGHQDVDVVTVPAVAKEPPATASDARDDPPRKGAESTPIHPSHSADRHDILRRQHRAATQELQTSRVPARLIEPHQDG